MKRIYRIAAGTLAALGGFAAIGAGAMIVATAILVGALMVLAAKLALRGAATDAAASPGDRVDADPSHA